MNNYVCSKCGRVVTVRSQAKVLNIPCKPVDGAVCSESPVEFKLQESKTTIVVSTKLGEPLVNKAPLPPSTVQPKAPATITAAK